MFTDRNPTSVIDNSDTVVFMDSNLDMVTVTCERFIDTVVHYFPDQMMQTFGTGGTDIHPRTFPYGFQSFKNLNFICTI
ncbi:hypothetical protein D3C74_425670 [compost metagenome]